MSVRRTLADWPMVAAAWLITVLAATLVSTGPIYSSAASVAGVRRAIAEASAADTTVRAAFFASAKSALEVERPIRQEFASAMGELGGSIIRDERSTETFEIPGQEGATVQDRAMLGALDGLADHATLTAGSWPAQTTAGSGPMEVALLDSIARRLDLTAGEELDLTGRSFGKPVPLPIRIVGLFRIDDPADRYWQDDAQLINGVFDSDSFRSIGPFFGTAEALAGTPAIQLMNVQWVAFPRLDRLDVQGAPDLRGRLAQLPGRLTTAAGQEVKVTTGLPDLLASAERSLLVSGASVLLLMLQLAILAAYAIVLTASLLVEHRRVETALLRSRGAGPVAVGLPALGEGLLLAVPAVLLAPWLAVAALMLLNVVGPLADAGLELHPTVSLDAYLAAAVAGLVCVALLVIPVLLAARSFASTDRERSRQETRTFGQRMGIDVALLALAGIALWQLRLYGAPLTRTVQGSLGLDPLLVAAPAIGLLTGGVLALRVLPLLAELAEGLVRRGRDLVVSLGIQQLARRPLRYTRAALLLMIAVSTGVFALCYTATWSASQQDQAAYQAGADVRATSVGHIGALPAWALRDTYAGLPGVRAVTPVARSSGELALTAGSGDLLAVDADSAADVVLLRHEGGTPTLSAAMASLKSSRPQLPLVALPPGSLFLRMTPRVQLDQLSGLSFDPVNGEAHEFALSDEELRSARVRLRATIRDAHGTLYEVASDEVPMFPAGRPIVVPLAPVDPRLAEEVNALGTQPDGPLQLAQLGVDLWLPADSVASGGEVGISAASTSATDGGPWADLPVSLAGGWRSRLRASNQDVEGAADQSRGVTRFLSGDGPSGTLFGEGPGRPPITIGFIPDALASLSQPISVIANTAFMTATGHAAGEQFSVTVEDEQRAIKVVAVVPDVPTAAPGRPTIVMDAQTLALLRLQSGKDPRPADEWWLATGDADPAATVAALRSHSLGTVDVTTVRDRARALRTDPVALGIIGALMLGFAAAGLFAVIGLTVSAAVSARQRRAEFAVLRALGLSGGQLSGWLWLENGTLVLVSVLAGTGLGVFIGWLVLPFVSVTQQGTAPVPSVLLDIPWDRIVLLDFASAVALGGAVLAIGGVMRRLGLGAALRMGED
jgi:hypothetical protein